jgi:hypothetical protein
VIGARSPLQESGLRQGPGRHEGAGPLCDLGYGDGALSGLLPPRQPIGKPKPSSTNPGAALEIRVLQERPNLVEQEAIATAAPHRTPEL